MNILLEQSQLISVNSENFKEKINGDINAFQDKILKLEEFINEIDKK